MAAAEVHGPASHLGDASATALDVLEVVGLSLLRSQAKAGARVVGRKANPAIAQGWQVSTGRKVTVAMLPCSARARPAGSQSCCWRARSKPAAVAPCPPGGSGRRCASPLWPPLAPLPSSALLAFPSYNRSIPAPAMPPLESNTRFCVQCREGLGHPCPRQTPWESRDRRNVAATAGRARCTFTFACLLEHRYLAAHVFAEMIAKQHSFPGETTKMPTACDRC